MTEVAVVTGGASGFGLALGERCAAKGMGVALLDRDGDRAVAEAAALAERHGIQTLGLKVDVGSAEDVDAAAAAVHAQFGRVDLVISNVGVQLFGSVDTFSDDEWAWVLNINVIGSARIARAFLPFLRQAERGRLAFTTSSSVLDPASRMAAYQSSKFAVWGLAETLRLELAEDGITVSVIFPSGMASRHLETSQEAQPENVRRPIGAEEDFTAMVASNPAMVEMVATTDDAARDVLEAIYADKPYVITHGDLTAAVHARSNALQQAAVAAATSS